MGMEFNSDSRIVVKSEDGRELRSFKFEDEDPSQEVRAVERRILLETLANQLPSNAISFSSKLKDIETSDSGDTILRLVDDSQISCKKPVIGREILVSGMKNQLKLKVTSGDLVKPCLAWAVLLAVMNVRLVYKC
ncbi:hypothetical protein CASFOL_042985 [Castilleja foliolosa]|uniref:Uncharacterized protein n=1 Tax=Castilleja foliolosa TaxID=1961234 RepID=A0ABD3B763_9LAMI